MRSLSDTLARLAKLRDLQGGGFSWPSHLDDLADFGANPGALEAKVHVPSSLADRPGLVVALHGCTQTAGAYDAGSGWSRLADDYGFIVLYPQQTRQNNPNTCFNWFLPADIRRDAGEALSIRQMIGTVINRHKIDPSRVFITGLSAGGAMANVMLATYPELFAGGAIIAGLPYAAATTVPEAFDRMRGHAIPSADRLQTLLRSASAHQGPWQTISVWHGLSDSTVLPVNGEAIVSQWQAVHGVDPTHSISEALDGYTVRSWKDRHGRVAIELFSIEGMAHGTPIDTGDGYGASGPYMLDVGISSTVHMARSWGLTPSFEKRSAASTVAGFGAPSTSKPSTSANSANGIQKVIEDALRSAGLMK